MQMSTAVQWAMTGTRCLLVRLMAAEKGSALSLARAKRNREVAWSCARTCRRRTKMRSVVMAMAPSGETARWSVKPYLCQRADQANLNHL